MQLGTIGLGRMGGNMVRRRLLRGGQQCVVLDSSPALVKAFVRENGATGGLG